MTHFLLFAMREKKLPVWTVSLVLLQNEDIGNFHGSLTLNKGDLT